MVRTILKLGGAAILGMSLFGASGCSAEIGEENTGETGDYLLAGNRLTPTQVADHLRRQGVPEAAVPRLVCTAKWESSFYDRASNRNNNGSTDRGLFQINSIHLGGTPGCGTSAEALYDPATNTRCAAAIYRTQGMNAWYGYKAHRAECDAYRLPTSNGGSSDGDACNSATLGRRVAEKSCVQARSDGRWYQCVDGAWLSGNPTSGPLGTCSATHSL